MTHPDCPSPVRFGSAPTYWRCEPSWSWHALPLADHLLWCVLDGVGHVTLGGRRRELRAGTCVVFAPGDDPVAGHDPRRRLLVFGLHLQGPEGGVALPDRWCQVRDQVLVESLARRCDSSYRRGDPLGLRQAQLCVDQLLALIWEESLHAPPGRVDAALEELTGAIRADPSRRWTVAELADRASLSRAQFVRRFTAHTGLPPVRYLIQARIARAEELLGETSMSVTQVAATLGYPDVAYFSRQYRSCTGRAPSRLR